MYYLQSRYYDPTIGRFLNPDTVYDYDAGFPGYNLFAYCGDNPVNRIDISGTDSRNLMDGDKEEEHTDEGGGDGKLNRPSAPPATMAGKSSNCGQVPDNLDTTRVGRWMSQKEHTEMVSTGRVQMSPNGNTTYVAVPADINAFRKQAKPGSLYVEFDVESPRIFPAGKIGCGQIAGPGSLYDRLRMSRGLDGFATMPYAYNITIVRGK